MGRTRPHFVRYRIALPLVFGFLAVGLIAWDLHNQRVIQSMGMAWDTGAPIWPYQASSLFLVALNAPAFVLATPFFFLLHLPTMEMRHPVLLPMIVFCWWWIGTRLDFGVLGRHHYRRPRALACVLAACAVMLFSAGAYGLINDVRWWRSYGHALPPVYLLLLLRTAGAVLWSFVIAAGCSLAAVRLFQGRLPEVSHKRKHPLLSAFAALGIVVLVAISLIGNAPEIIVDPESCVSDRESGCIHGTIAAQDGQPVQGIEVEAVPSDKTGDARWSARAYEWTDKEGRYSFDRLGAGEYFVSVHYYDAPDARHPYATTLYPGVALEQRAEKVVVKAASRTMLGELRLQTLPLTTIRVQVIWPDGTSPEWSNLLFHNVSYPSQAVIGDVAPAIEKGRGEFTLPEGFDYNARAKVDCDGESTIESRESRPVQQIKVGGESSPRELIFTVPGPPCKLWRPK